MVFFWFLYITYLLLWPSVPKLVYSMPTLSLTNDPPPPPLSLASSVLIQFLSHVSHIFMDGSFHLALGLPIGLFSGRLS